jgi:cell division protein FtsL
MWERSGHKSRAARAPVVHREHRYIFGGESTTAVSGYVVRQNRRTTRHRFSTFNLILAVFALGLIAVLYIHNIIMVNQLVVDVNTLQDRYQRQLKVNEALQAEINGKGSLKRIGEYATTNLGMVYPQEQPRWIPVEGDLHDRAEKVREEIGE